MPASDTPRRFPTTHWSLVVRLKSPDPAEARRAIEEICASYRYPLYGYLRASGLQHEDAEDVLQSFYFSMLRRDAFARGDTQRGRLRSYLLTCLAHFKSNWQRGEQRRHQRLQTESDHWDAEAVRWQQESAASYQTPEHFYDRRWALELLDRARHHLRADYEKRGKTALHDALSPHLVSVDGSASEDSLTQLAARLGMTANALSVALHRLRKDFRDIVLSEVKRTLGEDEDPQSELRHLLDLFES